ncbi:hypothetical protein S7711_10859 [Stachybotrys chartarum IBT 7711]|uniref:Uncharacterized protein n=1 Tax=Stachybotrys chartarum (strain CBS 109288 / IBT 7711) TaxID=1280523 RepID=A0A084AUE9_STACB|nr:hypothetical protein S7711_10859 [Stachybotrys chartarum IBT 7711]
MTTPSLMRTGAKEHDEASELEVGSHDTARQLHHHLRESDMNPCYPALDTVTETGEMNGGFNVGGGEGALTITVLAIFSPCAVESWQVANNQSTEKRRKAIWGGSVAFCLMDGHEARVRADIDDVFLPPGLDLVRMGVYHTRSAGQALSVYLRILLRDIHRTGEPETRDAPQARRGGWMD